MKKDKNKKIKILVLGSHGMLGYTVVKELSKHDCYEVKGLSRKDFEVGWNPLQDLLDVHDAYSYDYVLNCIGIIKPHINKDVPTLAIEVNSQFPHELADALEDVAKLIHITTDCVYSGALPKGSLGYSENSPHDALDIYGKTKSLGEPKTQAMVIRTSIIGEEVHHSDSLISWAKSQQGTTVNGYTNHSWNGITTKTYADVVHQIIQGEWWEKGLFHVHSWMPVTKFDMLNMFDHKYNLGLTVKSVMDLEGCNRILQSRCTLQRKLKIPTIAQQIIAI